MKSAERTMEIPENLVRGERSVLNIPDTITEVASIVGENGKEERHPPSKEDQGDPYIHPEFIELMEILAYFQKTGELKGGHMSRVEEIYGKHASIHPEHDPGTPLSLLVN